MPGPSRNLFSISSNDEILLQKLNKHRGYIMGINTYVGSVDFPAAAEWKDHFEQGDDIPMYVYMVGEVATAGLRVHSHGNVMDPSIPGALEEAELQIVLKKPVHPFYQADFIRGMERLEAIQDVLVPAASGEKPTIGIISDDGERCIRLVYPIFESTSLDSDHVNEKRVGACRYPLSSPFWKDFAIILEKGTQQLRDPLLVWYGSEMLDITELKDYLPESLVEVTFALKRTTDKKSVGILATVLEQVVIIQAGPSWADWVIQENGFEILRWTKTFRTSSNPITR